MNKVLLSRNIYFAAILCFLACCKPKGDTLFVKVPSTETGIYFSNTISENDSVNILTYYYCYNGGGIGLADFNNDGLSDVFFGGNMVSSKLYINQGGLKFQDHTVEAGLSTSEWILGVSVVDINQDGYTDIYLNVAGPDFGKPRRNLLYINNKDLTFTEQAEKFGLDDDSYAVQSAFFDYDRDGDLDMYLLTNDVDQVPKSTVMPASFSITSGKTIDKLYENVSDSLGFPFFKDVSKQVGINKEGYGLGLSIADLNLDGWPDVYTTSDFMPNDQLLINQKNKTFAEKAAESMRHQTYNGMGVDIADLNNDALPDILVMDMLSENSERRKTMISKMDFENHFMRQKAGYIDQYVRNTLQLNRGSQQGEDVFFSEIAQYSGLNATDWSWGTLLADYDNDGFNDVYITNGFVKDITDLDFINYGAESNMFGTNAIRIERTKKMLSKLKGVKLSNYMFRNKGNLSFENCTESWGLNYDSYSNGVVYADLDNDGDLDIITNNINENAFVFENKLNTRPEKGNFIQIDFEGSNENKDGIGANIELYCAKERFSSYNSPVRGYLSSMLEPLHIGVGKHQYIDSLRVQWPDGKEQVLRGAAVNKKILLHYDKATQRSKEAPAFSKVYVKTNRLRNINWTHAENEYNDFVDEPLLPYMLSKKGPGIAVGDIDGNSTTDFFIGGASGFSGTVFLQGADGTFKSKQVNQEDAEFEDMGAMFIDVDDDKDLDLYVVSGENGHKTKYEDRLYLNNGKGDFIKTSGVIPVTESSGTCVLAADFDNDGDLDIFRAGSSASNSYPTSEKSYFFRNDKGRFKDVSEEVANQCRDLGLINSSVSTDFDRDGWIDLIVVGDWMQPIFLRNVNGKFENVTDQTGLNRLNGWWNSIYPLDVDNDGDMDYVLGNVGNNVDYRPSEGYPLELYYGDFGSNGHLKPLLSQRNKTDIDNKRPFPLAHRDDLFRSIPEMRKRFNSYESYSKADIYQLFGDEKINELKKFHVDTFQSGVMLNEGKLHFSFLPFPVEAQLSSIYGVLSDDVNGDGMLDLIISGNSNSNEFIYGSMDASLGLLLIGKGNGRFSPVKPAESGLFLGSAERGLSRIFKPSGDQLILALSNSDSLIVLEKLRKEEKPIFPEHDDLYAIIKLKNGKQRLQEFQNGLGYLTQVENAVLINEQVVEVSFYKAGLEKRVVFGSKVR